MRNFKKGQVVNYQAVKWPTLARLNLLIENRTLDGEEVLPCSCRGCEHRRLEFVAYDLKKFYVHIIYLAPCEDEIIA